MAVSRQPIQVAESPVARDVIEIREHVVCPCSEESFEHESLLRVVAVHEERVWFKEYGKGHQLVTLNTWKERLTTAIWVKQLEDTV